MFTIRYQRKLIILSCYCTVHVYVVINFCDSGWSWRYRTISSASGTI